VDILQGIGFSGGWVILAGWLAGATAVLAGTCALRQSDAVMDTAEQYRNEEFPRRTENPLNGVAALFAPVYIPASTVNTRWSRLQNRNEH